MPEPGPYSTLADPGKDIRPGPIMSHYLATLLCGFCPGPQQNCPKNLSAFKEMGILTVTNIYLLEVIYLASSRQLQRHMNTHTYQTRNATDFALPIHHSSHFQSKPSYAGAKFFNVLPDTIKRADPIIFLKTSSLVSPTSILHHK
ncbi:hypothetical protein J6590_014487 [Homalodisca vitripennis]|nr:hypothetical protein J6590_014487 [Homalodisca vitripennis]